MKCEICGQGIAEMFLKKIKGTYVKDEKGKKHLVCFSCQKNIPTKKEMLEKIK